jgi:hypothetical protein
VSNTEFEGGDNGHGHGEGTFFGQSRSRCVRCVYLPPSQAQALALVVMDWSYLTITGNALLVKANYVIYLSVVLLSPPCCLVRPDAHD